MAQIEEVSTGWSISGGEHVVRCFSVTEPSFETPLYPGYRVEDTEFRYEPPCLVCDGPEVRWSESRYRVTVIYRAIPPRRWWQFWRSK